VTTAGGLQVSVALCTWNGEAFLAGQLRSIAAQRRRPDQLVICDDCSSDSTWSCLQQEAETLRGLGIQVDLHRHAANQGYVRNFEYALRHCRGDIVFLCDQDDVWHPDKVAEFAAAFERRPALTMLHGDARLVDGQGEPLGARLFEVLEVGADDIAREHCGEAFEVLLGRNVVTGATAALRRGLVDVALPVAPGWIHDEWLALVAAAGDGLDCLEPPLVDYRQHGGNQVGARRRGVRDRVMHDGAARRAYLTKRVAQLEALSARIDDGLVLSAERRTMVQQRLLHARARAALPGSFWARARQVWGEYRSGRYTRFSNGLRSLAIDLLDVK
jgi:glycosyltransferase involved in cell wall biosynthesis